MYSCMCHLKKYIYIETIIFKLYIFFSASGINVTKNGLALKNFVVPVDQGSPSEITSLAWRNKKEKQVDKLQINNTVHL